MSCLSILLGSIASALVITHGANTIGYSGNDCEGIFQACLNNTDCAPYAENQYNYCNDVYNDSMSLSSCPVNCSDALNAYISYIDPSADRIGEFCQCESDDCESDINSLVNVGCIASDCQAQFENCQNTTGCQSYATAYYNDCLEVIFNSTRNGLIYFGNTCPAACETALNEYIGQVAPNVTTLYDACDCNGEETCEFVKDTYEDLGCIASDCQEQFEDCSDDATCAPYAAAYYNACYPILNDSWSNTYCPDGCSDALYAYIDQVSNGNFTNLDNLCDCDDDDTCTRVKSDYYEVQCISNECETYFEDCGYDSECNVTRSKYYNACYDVINGNWDNDWCPPDCNYWLKKWIETVAPEKDVSLNFCDCEGATVCENSKDYLRSAGCLNDTGSCSQQFWDCQYNATCAPIGMAYYNACYPIINESWSNDYCPDGCSDALYSYIDAVNPSASSLDDLCNCNGDSTCEYVKDEFENVDCYDDSNECSTKFQECLEESECEAIATQYFEDCASILDDSYSGSTCPSNCSVSLTAYVSYVFGDSATCGSATDVCDCGDDSGCNNITQTFDDLECLICQQSTAAPSASPSPSSSSSSSDANSIVITNKLLFGVLLILSSVVAWL